MAMVNNGCHDFSHRFLQDDRFFSRLLSRGRYNSSNERYNASKQGGAGEASFRVLYYGGTAGAVPFLWESRPGTPKQKFEENALPPLTPPPSLSPATPTKPSRRKHRRQYSSRFFDFLFLKLPSKKINASPVAAAAAAAAYSPAASFLASPPFGERRSSGVGFGRAGPKSPTSTLCFCPGSGSPWSSPVKSVKKMVQSMVGSSDSE